MALAFLAQTVAPVPASAHSPGMLVEICSEFGVVTVRVDADGMPVEADSGPCPACTICAKCMIATSFDMPGVVAIATPERHAEPIAPALRDIPADNPARFWADNRGPPGCTEKARNVVHELPMGPARDDRGSSWI